MVLVDGNMKLCAHMNKGYLHLESASSQSFCLTDDVADCNAPRVCVQNAYIIMWWRSWFFFKDYIHKLEQYL